VLEDTLYSHVHGITLGVTTQSFTALLQVIKQWYAYSYLYITLARMYCTYCTINHRMCFSCCSPIISASAAASWLRLHQLLLPDCICFGCCSTIASGLVAAPRLHLLWLLLHDCICFGCCSPIASASVAAPDCVHLSCCSLIKIVPASAASPRLRLHPLQLLLTNCILLWSCTHSAKYQSHASLV